MKSFVYIIVYPDGTVKDVPGHRVIDELYYKLARVPKVSELPKGYDTKYITELRKQISLREEYIPLFDIYTKNIYLIEPDNLYVRIAKNDFRLPDEETMRLVKQQLVRYEKIIKGYKKSDVPKYYTYYVEQLNKHINFLSSFDFDTLRKTFYRMFFKNNPSIRDLTTCRRPSFWPALRNKPYYTKTQLLNMALNMNLKIDVNNLEAVCNKVADNDITAKVLNDHVRFLRGNNTKSFIQTYTFVGSHAYNSYLRFESQRDLLLEKDIHNMWAIIRKAPEFDKDYYVYRFVNDSSYLEGLKVGDYYNEKSFISTTRNPFYDPKNNIFGYVLIKIRIPKNIAGIGLCLESYSFFPDEEEILLAPGKLKLTKKDDNFTYYHPNAAAQSKIQKKYEFDYVEAIKQSPLSFTKDYEVVNIKIPNIDFTTLRIPGKTIKDKTNIFYNDIVATYNYRKYFSSQIGTSKYIFQVYYREDVRAYDKYFFLQKVDHMYWVIQDENTAEILLFMEIREKISVNFIFKYTGHSNPFPEDDFLTFLANVAYAFQINEVIIHDDYTSYEKIADRILQTNNLNQDDFNNPDTHAQHLMSAVSKFYPVDLMNFIISKGNYVVGDIDKTYRPRFASDSLKPFIKKSDIIELGDIKAMDVLDTNENNPITKLYMKFNKEYKLVSALDFYLYLHFNYFYFVKIYNKYLMKYYDKNLRPTNLWDANFYVFSPYDYLYKKGVITDIPDVTSYDNIPDSQKSKVIKKIRDGMDIF